MEQYTEIKWQRPWDKHSHTGRFVKTLDNGRLVVIETKNSARGRVPFGHKRVIRPEWVIA